MEMLASDSNNKYYKERRPTTQFRESWAVASVSPRLFLIVVVTIGTHCGEHKSGDVWPIFSVFTHQGNTLQWWGLVLLGKSETIANKLST